MKRCMLCKIEKAKDLFHKNKAGRDGLLAICKECNKAKSRKWSSENTDKSKNSKLLKAYGITLEQYNFYCKSFGKVCHICRKKCPSGRKLAVDHDHKSEVIRGLLCINCNKGLGNFKDSPKLLLKAIDYLENFKKTKRHVNYVMKRRRNAVQITSSASKVSCHGEERRNQPQNS